MPGDSFYWSPVENDTDESFQEKEGYIDPWDLENYAYIREHLESMELSPSPSVPSGSSGEFAEATHSFDYVPGKKRAVPPYMSNPREGSHFDSMLSEQENYADIEEVQYYERRNRRATSETHWPIRRRDMEEYESEEVEEVSPYAEGIVQENPVFGIYDKKGIFRKVALPISYPKLQKDRSLSFSYGDFGYDQYSSSTRPDIYSKLEDNQSRAESIYDDVRRNDRHPGKNKPQNFGFSKYGHLKIDYSCSWNNLNKYMKYN